MGWFDPVLTRYAMQARFVENYGVELEAPTAPEGSAARLAQQQALTRALFQVTPTLDAVPEGDFADWVERTLGARVGVTSHGPTFADKQWRVT